MLGSMLTGSHRFKLPNSSICAGDAQRGGLCTSDGGAPLTCIIGETLNHYIWVANGRVWCGHENVRVTRVCLDALVDPFP